MTSELRAPCRCPRRRRPGAFEVWATPIYDRNKMQTDLQIPGPAIVSEMDSTTVILPGYHAMVDTVGNLLINPAK